MTIGTAALIVNSVLLAAATMLLAWLAADGAVFSKARSVARERLGMAWRERNLRNEIRRHTGITAKKLNLRERIELHLIDRSNIRHFMPFMDFNALVFLCFALFLGAFVPVYRLLAFIPSAVVVCFLFSLTPIFALDVMGKYNSEKIRRGLAEFISVLNRWCSVKEDIFYAFGKSVDSGIGMPLKAFIRDMVIQVDRGIKPPEALDILQMKVDNAQFKDFIVNIKQNVKHRGDIRKLLGNLEEQFYKIEEEYNRRKISTYRDRLMVYAAMFGVLAVGYCFLRVNPRVEEFYLQTLQGKSLLSFFCILYACGACMTFKIAEFRH